MINIHTHQLLEILGHNEDRFLQIVMSDGNVFVLTAFDPIDTSIYNEVGGWCAEVVSMISDPENKFHKPRSGLDFYEKDVLSIMDAETKVIVYNKDCS